MRDDLDAPVPLDAPARRVVSLVPSLTEAIAATCPDVLVGVTDWCTHPADLTEQGVARVRGTKNPNRAAIEALRPDLVVANQEENRELDVVRLREKGIAVWVTRIETLDEAFTSMRRLFTEALGVAVPAWLTEAQQLWDDAPSAGPAGPARPARVAVPIWRDPWMVVGPRTFTTDLLARLGWTNAFGGEPGSPSAERYPHADLADIDRADLDLVMLPDEPYVFTEHDGPEAFATAPTELVSGRLLTWYGPALIEAHRQLPRPA